MNNVLHFLKGIALGDYPTRKHPAKGVFNHSYTPTIVFLTICTHGRIPWLTNANVHASLIDAWNSATAWYVGRYMIMPDHIHMFVAPGNRNTALEIWVGYWKSLVTKRLQQPHATWQKECFHHRLRNHESYDQKWQYVVNNPVRKGLVARPEDWPYAGELETLRW